MNKIDPSLATFLAALAYAQINAGEGNHSFEMAFRRALTSTGETTTGGKTTRFASLAERVVNSAKLAGLVSGPLIVERPNL